MHSRGQLTVRMNGQNPSKCGLGACDPKFHGYGLDFGDYDEVLGKVFLRKAGKVKNLHRIF